MAIHSVSCHLHFQSHENSQPVMKLLSYEEQEHQDISHEMLVTPLHMTKLENNVKL
jgi:hypothetical protein